MHTLPAFHLSIVQPSGYVHSLGLLDQARYFRYQLRRAGARVTMAKNRLRSDAVNLVFGAHLGFDPVLLARHSCVFVNLEQRFALMGDVLFRGSVGRTDLPGGDHQALIRSIKTKVLPLGDEVAFVCGHGPTSTIGEERATNPFIL